MRPQLRFELVQLIEAWCVDHPPFRPEDFGIEEGLRTQGREEQVTISICTSSRTYSIQFTIPNQPVQVSTEDGYRTEFRFRLELRPGDVSEQETAEALGVKQLKFALWQWLGRLHQDVEADAHFQSRVKMRETLEQVMLALESVPASTRLGDEEVRQWERKLEVMHHALSAQIQSVSRGQVEVEQRLGHRVDAGFSEIKEQLQTRNKRNFLRTAALFLAKLALEEVGRDLLSSAIGPIRVALSAWFPSLGSS